MKRGVFGILLLVFLLFAGLWESRQARRDLTFVVDAVDLSSQAVLRGDFQKTAALTGEARAAWETYTLRYSFLSRQQAVREIDSLYDQVEVFLNAGEGTHCSATCAILKSQLQAMLEDQQLSLHNLL